MRIIQGQNDPILIKITPELATAERMSAQLIRAGNVVKSWSEKVVADDVLMLNITEAESLDFKPGGAILDIKFLKNDRVIFADLLDVAIIKRANKDELGAGNPTDLEGISVVTLSDLKAVFLTQQDKDEIAEKAKGEPGPPGPSYDDTEIKEALAKVGKVNTYYGTTTSTLGALMGVPNTKAKYDSAPGELIVCKETLDNVLEEPLTGIAANKSKLDDTTEILLSKILGVTTPPTSSGTTSTTYRISGMPMPQTARGNISIVIDSITTSRNVKPTSISATPYKNVSALNGLPTIESANIGVNNSCSWEYELTEESWFNGIEITVKHTNTARPTTLHLTISYAGFEKKITLKADVIKLGNTELNEEQVQRLLSLLN